MGDNALHRFFENYIGIVVSCLTFTAKPEKLEYQSLEKN